MDQTPRAAARKPSASRWTIGLAIVLAAGVIAWLATDDRGQSSPDLAPQNQSGTGSNDGTSQPPAAVQNQDSGTGTPAPSPPAGEGTTQ